jgi:hypothetical protein
MKLNEIKRSWESEDQHVLLLQQGIAKGGFLGGIYR